MKKDWLMGTATPSRVCSFWFRGLLSSCFLVVECSKTQAKHAQENTPNVTLLNLILIFLALLLLFDYDQCHPSWSAVMQLIGLTGSSPASRIPSQTAADMGYIISAYKGRVCFQNNEEQVNWCIFSHFQHHYSLGRLHGAKTFDFASTFCVEFFFYSSVLIYVTMYYC